MLHPHYRVPQRDPFDQYVTAIHQANYVGASLEFRPMSRRRVLGSLAVDRPAAADGHLIEVLAADQALLHVGVMAVHDYRARVLVDACLRLGLDAPHDVAVIGTDNDPTICEFCQPTLSSISRSAWKVGYEAAALLDRLMAGNPAPEHDILIPPDGLVARLSTDTIAVDARRKA